VPAWFAVAQCVAEFAAGGHETAFAVEQRAINGDGPLEVGLGDLQSKFLRGQ